MTQACGGQGEMHLLLIFLACSLKLMKKRFFFEKNWDDLILSGNRRL
jgi:hypothetical protein